MDKLNLTLLTDLYELTMMQGYYCERQLERGAIFDMYYRDNPDHGGYALCCGLEQVIDLVRDFHFGTDDIEYLRSLGIFREDFLEYLRDFRFTGDIWAVPEGTVVFPREPLVKVRAPIMQAQLLETALLNIINHQTLIATKASRVVQAAEGDGVMEFGLRRAQGPDAGIYGARAAVIGGCVGTSDVLAAKIFDVPPLGTHAHSWIMSFEDELTAFRVYASLYPDNCTLLIDTYDTLRSGLPNALTVFKEMREQGIGLKKYGVRIDSGDLAYLSKEVRKAFVAEGFDDVTISASNDLDEYLIASLKQQGAAINSWGVGTRLITSNETPALGGVYKLSAIQDMNTLEYVPRIKISENVDKITNPGNKVIYRIYDRANSKIIADLIALEGERPDEDSDLVLFDPDEVWKRTRVRAGTFSVRELLIPIFRGGRLVYTERPSVMELRERAFRDKDTLWDEARRLSNPHVTHVDLTQKLWDLRKDLLDKYSHL